MVRTQIYLTEEERAGLLALAAASGKSQSELIREAVDRLIARVGKSRKMEVIEAAVGMWSDRKDLPDFSAARRSWERS